MKPLKPLTQHSQGKESDNTRTNRVNPLPAFFPFLAILSFRKKKKGGEDLGELGSDLDIPDGDTMHLGAGLEGGLGGSLGGGLSQSNGGLGSGTGSGSLGGGLGGSLGGGLGGSLGGDLGGGLGGGLGGSDDLLGGLKGNDEKMNEMTGTIEDLKGQVETLQLQGKSVKGDMEQIKTDLGTINDSMKSLLCIYEAVSKEYNPFVEEAEKKAPAKAKAQPVKEEKLPELPKELSLGLDDTTDDPLDIVMRPQDNYEAVVMENKKAKRPETIDLRPPMPAMQVMPEPELRAPEMRLPCMDMHQPTPSYKADLYCMNQIYKLIEFHLDKIFIQKQKGIKVPESEFDALERWLKELRRMEVN